jgi:hypothetical protein
VHELPQSLVASWGGPTWPLAIPEGRRLVARRRAS